MKKTTNFRVVRNPSGYEPANAVSKGAMEKHIPMGGSGLIRLVKERSLKGHDFFFSCVDKLYKTLPEEFDEGVTCAEHFRAWSLCKIGHRVSVECTGEKSVVELINRLLLDEASPYLFFHHHNEVAYITYAKSMKWSKMSGAEFQEVTSKISDLWDREFGVTLSQLKKSIVEDAQ